LPARGLVVMPGAVDVHLHLGHGKDIAARGNLWMPTGKRRRRQKAASPPLFLI
jgi:imidazolonepropionase-like amidohydrolase